MNKDLQRWVGTLVSAGVGLTGLWFFHWDMFSLIWVFWWENLIRNLAVAGRVRWLRRHGVETSVAAANLKSRLFLNLIFGVFIVVGLGLVLPFSVDEQGVKLTGLIAFARALTFQDWSINLALLILIVKEVADFLPTVWKKGAAVAPLARLPQVLEGPEVVLFGTVLFGFGLAFWLRQPANLSLSQGWDQRWILWIPALLMISLQAVVRLWPESQPPVSPEDPSS